MCDTDAYELTIWCAVILAKVLTALRNDVKLPNGFEKEVHPTEAEPIRWLLQEDPNARLTSG